MNTAGPSVLDAISLPDADVKRRYEALVGIDDIKRELLSALRIGVNPKRLEAWAAKNHGVDQAIQLLIQRPQLFILGGDVGTGKTELAETIGDALARVEQADVTLYSLSLSARGTGFVGEMTQRIVSAFDVVREWGEKRKTQRSARRSMALLFIDEADAIAQSRESAQMHHEDRAGVNALIRGIDDLTRARVPAAILMSTNRLEALDPAIRRRAANVFSFSRPNSIQRRAVFSKILPDLPDIARLDELVHATGPSESRAYGFTYSDIVQRLIPSAVLDAYEAESTLTVSALISVCKRIVPTPPFTASGL